MFQTQIIQSSLSGSESIEKIKDYIVTTRWESFFWYFPFYTEKAVSWSFLGTNSNNNGFIGTIKNGNFKIVRIGPCNWRVHQFYTWYILKGKIYDIKAGSKLHLSFKLRAFPFIYLIIYSIVMSILAITYWKTNLMVSLRIFPFLFSVLSLIVVWMAAIISWKTLYKEGIDYELKFFNKILQ
jgi:hypothetical protein